MKHSVNYEVVKKVFDFEWDHINKCYIKQTKESGIIKLKDFTFDKNMGSAFSVVHQMKRNGFDFILSNNYIVFKHKDGPKFGYSSMSFNPVDMIYSICKCAVNAMDDMLLKETLYNESLDLNKKIKELTEREDYYESNGFLRTKEW